MKLAVSLGHGLTPSESVDAAVKLERFGYDFLWVSESVGFDSLPVLGAAANRTSKIGLGTGVVNVYSRSATQIAMAAATIDALSHGRFILGIGASSAGVVEGWHGLNFKGQLNRVAEYTDELRSKLRRRSGLPLPFSHLRNNVPVFVAGVGDRMVALAKRRADGVLFFMRPFSDVEVQCRRLASRSFRMCANVVSCVSDNQSAAEMRARRTVAFYLTYGEAYRRLVVRLSPHGVGEVISAVRSDWLKGRSESASKRIPDALLDELAIYGTPSDCRKRIEEYSRIKGLHMLGLHFNPVGRSISESIAMLASLPESP